MKSNQLQLTKAEAAPAFISAGRRSLDGELEMLHFRVIVTLNVLPPHLSAQSSLEWRGERSELKNSWHFHLVEREHEACGGCQSARRAEEHAQRRRAGLCVLHSLSLMA